MILIFNIMVLQNGMEIQQDISNISNSKDPKSRYTGRINDAYIQYHGASKWN